MIIKVTNAFFHSTTLSVALISDTFLIADSLAYHSAAEASGERGASSSLDLLVWMYRIVHSHIYHNLNNIMPRYTYDLEMKNNEIIDNIYLISFTFLSLLFT